MERTKSSIVPTVPTCRQFHKAGMGKKMRFALVLMSVLIALFFCFATPVYSSDVTLGWDQDAGAAGYKIYYKPGDAGGRILENYNGKGAAEGDSPITMPSSLDENSDPHDVEFTLHNLDDNKPYVFVVTAYNDTGLESSGSREIQILDTDDIPTPYNMDYNSGWRITAGDLQGFTVYYHDSDGIVPTLGPTDDIPTLRKSIADVQGVGTPLNLEPSGSQFSLPVTLLIPCPGYWDVSGLDVYYYDDHRAEWFLAHDADDDPDVVQPEAVGWLVAGSRVNHNTGNPSTIEIRVNHFSGVQAAAAAGSQPISSNSDSGVAAAGGGGGCFIDALTGK
jgi:hypothetical protein